MFDVGPFRGLTRLFVNPTFTKRGGGFGGTVYPLILVSVGEFPSFLRVNLGLT